MQSNAIQAWTKYSSPVLILQIQALGVWLVHGLQLLSILAVACPADHDAQLWAPFAR